MNDMSGVITPKSDQWNADDLLSGPRTIIITEVDIRPGTEQPVSIHFEGGNGKVFRPCKSMSRVLVAAWGPDAKAYVGRSVTLYRDPTVKWGGMEVGGIRISHLSNIERDMVMALTATKGKRAPYTVKPLTNTPATKDPNAAEKWVNDHLGFVAGAVTTERLDELVAGGTKAVAKLQANSPDLHRRVTDAYAERRAAIAGDDPFEGRTDAQHGDQHDGTDDRPAADILLDKITAADLIADVLAIETNYKNGGREMFEIAEQDRIEAAIDARKGALS